MPPAVGLLTGFEDFSTVCLHRKCLAAFSQNWLCLQTGRRKLQWTTSSHDHWAMKQIFKVPAEVGARSIGLSAPSTIPNTDTPSSIQQKKKKKKPQEWSAAQISWMKCEGRFKETRGCLILVWPNRSADLMLIDVDSNARHYSCCVTLASSHKNGRTDADTLTTMQMLLLRCGCSYYLCCICHSLQLEGTKVSKADQGILCIQNPMARGLGIAEAINNEKFDKKSDKKRKEMIRRVTFAITVQSSLLKSKFNGNTIKDSSSISNAWGQRGRQRRSRKTEAGYLSGCAIVYKNAEDRLFDRERDARLAVRLEKPEDGKEDTQSLAGSCRQTRLAVTRKGFDVSGFRVSLVHHFQIRGDWIRRCNCHFHYSSLRPKRTTTVNANDTGLISNLTIFYINQLYEWISEDHPINRSVSAEPTNEIDVKLDTFPTSGGRMGFQKTVNKVGILLGEEREGEELGLLYVMDCTSSPTMTIRYEGLYIPFCERVVGLTKRNKYHVQCNLSSAPPKKSETHPSMDPPRSPNLKAPTLCLGEGPASRRELGCNQFPGVSPNSSQVPTLRRCVALRGDEAALPQGTCASSPVSQSSLEPMAGDFFRPKKDLSRICRVQVTQREGGAGKPDGRFELCFSFFFLRNKTFAGKPTIYSENESALRSHFLVRVTLLRASRV
ncbi:hypothetical protein VP01_1670g1 [Puccinia sorghi]|uniref:Uncharacterized protein n=1 Tax=Puccinia sorghi TaxID=27349 RepID=A0A0L6VGN8_9BASI|nr:hypothetical protein VP01_1670g1 [Puccinia sorghi]